MLKTVYDIFAVSELSLNPFQIAKPRAVNKFIQHSGRNKIWYIRDLIFSTLHSGKTAYSKPEKIG